MNIYEHIAAATAVFTMVLFALAFAGFLTLAFWDLWKSRPK